MNSTKAPLRLATVEDDPRYRAGLRGLLGGLPRFSLADSYAAAGPLLEAARRAQQAGVPAPWDVVLTDIGLPAMDGVELTRMLKAMHPALRVVVLTVFEDPATVLAAICAGADGYLLKTASAQELCVQIEQIAAGGAPLSTALAGTLMRLVRASAADRFAPRLPRDLGLTPRQLDVLRALVDGCSYREVGERLGISLDTVRNHVRQVYAALQVHSVAEAVTYALRHGLA